MANLVNKGSGVVILFHTRLDPQSKIGGTMLCVTVHLDREEALEAMKLASMVVGSWGHLEDTFGVTLAEFGREEF